MYPSCIIVEGVCRKQHIAAGRPELGRMSQNIRTRVKTRVTTRPLAFVVNVVREGVCLSVVHFSFSLFLCCVCCFAAVTPLYFGPLCSASSTLWHSPGVP